MRTWVLRLATALLLVAVFAGNTAQAASAPTNQVLDDPEPQSEPDPAIDPDWDPVEELGLEDLPLAGVPEFNFQDLQQSERLVDALGQFSTVGVSVDVDDETTDHLRALQALATIDNAYVAAELGVDTEIATIRSLLEQVDATRKQVAGLEQSIHDSEARADVHRAELIEEQAVLRRLEGERDELQIMMNELALLEFIGSDQAARQAFSESGEARAMQVVSGELREDHWRTLRELEAAVEQSRAKQVHITQTLTPVLDSIADLHTTIANHNRTIGWLYQQRRAAQRRTSAHWAQLSWLRDVRPLAETFVAQSETAYRQAYDQTITGFIRGTDLPLVALNAYVAAERVLARERPSCGIHWSQLAGIGRVESFHGHFGTSTLDVDGTTTTAITGPALDGTAPFAFIADSDDGTLDGDTVYDRAVGPMQFIPTTWKLVSSDGNDDGVADPQNVYDAAVAAGRYLCSNGRNMLTSDGEQAAYWAYNHDLEYSNNVTAAGRRYHRLLNRDAASSPFSVFARLPTPEQVAAEEEAASTKAPLQ